MALSQETARALFRWRTWVSWLLLAIMFGGPFVRINGNPLLLINIVERRFSILGQIFWPQDMVIFGGRRCCCSSRASSFSRRRLAGSGAVDLSANAAHGNGFSQDRISHRGRRRRATGSRHRAVDGRKV